MKSLCPYDNNVICSYPESDSNSPVSECWGCTHYHPQPLKMDDPLEKRSVIGCLIIGAILIIGFLSFAAWIINQLKENL